MRSNSFDNATDVAEAKIIQRYAEERLESDENGRLSMTAIKMDFKQWAVEKGLQDFIDLSNFRFSVSSNNPVLESEPSYVKVLAEDRWQYILGCRFKSESDADSGAAESVKADSRLGPKLKKTTKRAK